jgi:hypothetical protein
MKILGSYGKGTKDSVTINYGRSAGILCDTKCAHHPDSTLKNAPKDCYAVRIESRPDRVQLKNKLDRHESTSPAILTAIALLEIQALVAAGQKPDFVRISTNGAVPPKSQWEPMFETNFRALMSYCSQQNIPVHFPTETDEKAEDYRELVGDYVTVRESIHVSDDVSAFVHASGAVSTSIGAGLPLLERIEVSQKLCDDRRAATGRITAVCPAVKNSFKAKIATAKRVGAKRRNSPELPQLELAELKAKVLAGKSKCGNCTLCARRDVDVIYPAH